MRGVLLIFFLALLTLPLAALDSPHSYASESRQTINCTPALVYSQIDGRFTNVTGLKLTPLGEKLVSQDSRWMPNHEWADALSLPQTLYDRPFGEIQSSLASGSLVEGNAYVRLKYYEKGWIDNNRWLDILVDHVADPSIDKSTPQDFWTDGLLVYFNPSQDYSGNSPGDYLFALQYISSMVRLIRWKAPFTSGYWEGPWEGDVPAAFGTGKSSVGISPDFPKIGPHLIYELRINLDALGLPPTSVSPGIRIGDSFGFALAVDDFGSKVSRRWPMELAQTGFLPSAHGTSVIPAYSGVVSLAENPVNQATTVTTTATYALAPVEEYFYLLDVWNPLRAHVNWLVTIHPHDEKWDELDYNINENVGNFTAYDYRSNMSLGVSFGDNKLKVIFDSPQGDGYQVLVRFDVAPPSLGTEGAGYFLKWGSRTDVHPLPMNITVILPAGYNMTGFQPSFLSAIPSSLSPPAVKSYEAGRLTISSSATVSPNDGFWWVIAYGKQTTLTTTTPSSTSVLSTSSISSTQSFPSIDMYLVAAVGVVILAVVVSLVFLRRHRRPAPQ